MRQHPLFLAAFLAALFLVSCGSLERNIDIKLPEVPRQLVVECYLEAGQPYRVFLTETKGYFDDLDECPLVSGATVIIRHAGRADTLAQAPFLGECTLTNPNFLPFFNQYRTRFYNYGSPVLCPLSYTEGFELEVIDERGGRRLLAQTKMLPPLGIESITMTFNERDKASAFVRTLPDDPAQADFYRLMLHSPSLYSEQGFFNLAIDPDFDATLADARLFNGKSLAWGTPYRYEEGDTLIASVYRIEEAYYTYLNSIQDSERSNGSPFSQPPAIQSNVQGGLGVFTFLSYARDTIYVQR